MAGDYGYQREELSWVVPQGSFGTLAQVAASNAIRHTKLSFTAEEARKLRTDLRDTRSARERIRGKRKAGFSYEGYLRPSGSAGTAPDEGELLKAAFGVETISGGVSVTYSFHKNPEQVLTGLSIHKYLPGFAQAVKDALVDSLSIKVSGDGEAMLEVSGMASDLIHAGASDTAAGLSGGESSIVLVTGDGKKFCVGSKIDVGSSLGHVLTGPTDAYGFLSSDTVTLTPTISGAQSSGADIVPSVPAAQTLAGNPISGVVGSVTVNAVALRLASVAFTVKPKYKFRENEYGTVIPSAFFSPGLREVEIEIEVYVTKDQFKYFGYARTETSRDLAVVIGSGAGTQCTINADRVLFDIPALDVADENETTLKLKGICVSDGTAENEATVVF